MKTTEIELRNILDRFFYQIDINVDGEKVIVLKHNYTCADSEAEKKQYFKEVDYLYTEIPIAELVEIIPEERDCYVFEYWTNNADINIENITKRTIIRQVRNLIRKENLMPLDFADITADASCGMFYNTKEITF